jgi:hypothetical protein
VETWLNFTPQTTDQKVRSNPSRESISGTSDYKLLEDETLNWKRHYKSLDYSSLDSFAVELWIEEWRGTHQKICVRISNVTLNHSLFNFSFKKGCIFFCFSQIMPCSFQKSSLGAWIRFTIYTNYSQACNHLTTSKTVFFQ